MKENHELLASSSNKNFGSKGNKISHFSSSIAEGN